MTKYDPIIIYILLVIVYILEQEFGVLDLKTHLVLLILATLLTVVVDAIYLIYEKLWR